MPSPSTSVEEAGLFYHVYQILGLDSHTAAFIPDLEYFLVEIPLSGDDMKTLWYIFGYDKEWICKVVENIASFDLDEGLIELVLSNSMPIEQRNELLRKIEARKKVLKKGFYDAKTARGFGNVLRCVKGSFSCRFWH